MSFSRLFILALGLKITLALWVSTTSAQTIQVPPYIQPGKGHSSEKFDGKVLCWFTDQKPGNYVVEWQIPGESWQTVKPKIIPLDFAKLVVAPKKTATTNNPEDTLNKTGKLPPEQEQHYFKYVAEISPLPLNAEVRYRVKLENELIREEVFRTRATPDRAIRFAMVGDLANGKVVQNLVAYQIYQEKPDFMVALGDIVYPAGRVNQYMHFFWKTFNQQTTPPGPKTGVPLMASIPLYPVLGNHDVAAKLPAIPDALGAFYFFLVSGNGPLVGSWNTALGSDKAAAQRFRSTNADSYPALDYYSFDYGPAHILVLNSNQSGNAFAPGVRQWVEKDLTSTKARWKFVCFHNPAFSSSNQHYTHQAVRLWHPLFEKCGVDVVFAGHVHNYQRTVPLRFTPAAAKPDKKGKVDGTFQMDRKFDGEKLTSPDGIIHIVAGGGGATLYGPGLEKTAPLLRQTHGDNYADYTARMVVDRHSFTLIELSPQRFSLRAIDGEGKVLDRFAIEKP